MMDQNKVLFFLLICFIPNILLTQCVDIHFMRTSFGLGSDDAIYVYSNEKYLFTVNRGDRVDVEVCGTDQISFSASLTQDQISIFNGSTLNLSEEDEFYIRVGAVFGLDAPTLTKMDLAKGKNLYGKNNKFKGIKSTFQVGNDNAVSQNTVQKNTVQVSNNSSSSQTAFNNQSDPKSNEIPIPSVEGLVADMIQSYTDRVKHNGFERFYVRNNQLYDSDNDQAVAEGVSVGFGKVLSENKFIIISAFEQYNHVVQVFDGSGKKINSYQLEGFIAPNCKYVITLEDKDIWRSEIEIESGKMSPRTRLTELGLFDRRFYHQHWYKNKIVFRPQGGPATVGTQYEIDVNTATITNLHDKFEAPANFVPISGNDELLRSDIANKSPDLRYAYTVKGRKPDGSLQLGFYDLEHSTININAPSSEYYYWTSDKHIISREVKNGRELFLYIHDISSGTSEHIGETVAWPNSRKEMSLNGEFFLYLSQNVLEDREAYVYSVENGSLDLLEKDGASMLSSLNFRGTYNSFSWISNHEVIYVKGGDIINQGTWYYNAKTKTKKKIFSFKASRIETLLGTNFTYIWANDNLYKYDRSTKETEQLKIENRYEMNSFSKIHFEKPLYRLKGE